MSEIKFFSERLTFFHRAQNQTEVIDVDPEMDEEQEEPAGVAEPPPPKKLREEEAHE